MGAEFVLSGFGDEIAPELTEQIDVLASEAIYHVEFRAAWGRNVLALSDEEIITARDLLAGGGMRVSAVGSPIGKVDITGAFDDELARFRRAVWVAHQLQTPFIRIFSFFVPPGEAATWRDEVLRRMTVLADEARAAGLILLHENERHLYGDTPERCRDLIESVGSPALRVTFDPANFVVGGMRPFDDAYPILRDYIIYWHVKDAHADGRICPAGQGDAQWPDLLRSEVARGFRGIASLEPHLQQGGQFGGFSGPERFREAVAAFRMLLGQQGADE